MFQNDSKFRIMQHSSPRRGSTPKPAPREAAATDAPGPRTDLPSSTLGRMRLLVALDALLVEGSVTRAAKTLDMSVPAMSRLLSQLRELYGDEIVTRAGRALVPTPFAENLRDRVRALTNEASDLLQNAGPSDNTQPAGTPTSKLPIIQNPPLAISPTVLLEGEPDSGTLARRLADIGTEAAPKQRLAGYISTVGAGIGQSRPLTRAEAEDALRIILEGEADPIQIGALLVAMQYRSITGNELAGMVEAARRNCLPLETALPDPGPDIDWPAYRSPRNRSAPWFLLAAKLVAQAGYRVVLHGYGSADGTWHSVLESLDIPTCLTIEEARDQMRDSRIAFIPLAAIDAQLQGLLSLYRLFEMRSPLNHVVQLLNPLAATHSFLGVPSAAARTLQRDAASMLGWRHFAAIASNRDIAQATPFHSTRIVLLENGAPRELSIPALDSAPPRSPRNGFSPLESCVGLWRGSVKDAHATEIVISTAAFALMSLSDGDMDIEAARTQAAALWSGRRP